MATSWTNPISAGTPIRAFDIQEVITAINANRSSAGLSAYPWTDPTVSSGTAIKTVHFTDMRSAIQDLWNHIGMGALPAWSSASKPNGGIATGKQIYANDLADVRAWLNQYENDPPVSPLKGIHMSHNQFRDVDRKALDLASPSFGMIVALRGDLGRTMTNEANLYGDSPTMADVLNWYGLNKGTEIFVRLYPTYGPVAGPGPLGGYEERSPQYVVDRIVEVRNTYGANFRRIIPGNEPNIEWPGTSSQPASRSYHDWQGATVTWSTQWHWGKWQAMNAYYAEILNELNARKTAGTAPADIELYYPAMAQGAGAEGKGSYCDNGTVTSMFLEHPDGTPHTTYYGFGSYGYDHLKGSIEGQPGYTDGYKRFTWHNYFYSWHSYDHSVVRYFPDWLYADLFTIEQPFPSRITECGWYPGPLSAPGGEPRHRDSAPGYYIQYACGNPNMPWIETVTGPNGGPSDPSEGYYHDDLYWFISHGRDAANPPAGGVAIWLLSSYDPEFAPHAAIPRNIGSYIEKGWFTNYRQWSGYP